MNIRQKYELKIIFTSAMMDTTKEKKRQRNFDKLYKNSRKAGCEKWKRKNC